MKCYKCNKLGHIKRNFPERGDNREVTQQTQENDISDSASDTKGDSDCDICLMVSKVSVVEKNYWIYDSDSTCHMGPSWV